MVIGVPKETFPGETRVGLVPGVLILVKRLGGEVIVETGAGLAAGVVDKEFEDKGARIASRDEVFSQSDVIVQVRTYGANPEAGKTDLTQLKNGQIVIGFGEPLAEAELAKEFSQTGSTLFALELLPRITRAQSMDVLSSMATVAGYKAVLIAANELPRMFPMMMTAAGTVAPAKVLVIGAGVAGLQAIASAKRHGAVVSAYDVRPAVKEQVESLGAKFVEMELETAGAEDKGGYAKEMGEEFIRKQRELMTKVVAENDIVITTAAIPGKKSPILVTEEMVKGMQPGSVIVDLAAERGGNCELTKAGETVVYNNVKIIGPINLPAMVAFHASQMYARNVTTFLQNMVKDGEINLNMEDEIISDTMVTRDGDVVNPRVREILGLATAGEAA
ncbi:MAG: Re/Si-specific NAD(P)(+) transhydrogenase subunit alpha [Candidatus Krumholzibacteria bacterium]|nr:Re/Si-specific NAD(P)(+) transhydrogenase subunit alpha [Candidatus Krumholzibacteria bacterium]